MTKAELIKALENYPDDMVVCITDQGQLEPVRYFQMLPWMDVGSDETQIVIHLC